jgi:hypothetical protein
MSPGQGWHRRANAQKCYKSPNTKTNTNTKYTGVGGTQSVINAARRGSANFFHARAEPHRTRNSSCSLRLTAPTSYEYGGAHSVARKCSGSRRIGTAAAVVRHPCASSAARFGRPGTTITGVTLGSLYCPQDRVGTDVQTH